MSAAGFQSAEGTLIIAHRGVSGYAPREYDGRLRAGRAARRRLHRIRCADEQGRRACYHPRRYGGWDDEFYGQCTTVYAAGAARHGCGELFPPLIREQPSIVSEVMSRFAGKIGMFIEIKGPRSYPGIEEKVAEIVRR